MPNDVISCANYVGDIGTPKLYTQKRCWRRADVHDVRA